MRQFLDPVFNAFGERHGRDRNPAGVGRRGEGDCLPLAIGIQDRTTGDLVPIVVLSIDPEDTHHRHAVLPRQPVGHLDGCQRFQQGEQRAAEQSGLLARDDGHRAWIGEETCRGHSLGGRSALPLLRRDHRSQIGPGPGVGLHARDRLNPGLRVRRVTGKEPRDRGVTVDVIGCQLSDPREASHVRCDGNRDVRGGALFGVHRGVLSQSAAQAVKATRRQGRLCRGSCSGSVLASTGVPDEDAAPVSSADPDVRSECRP
jgi:hypothetical protein